MNPLDKTLRNGLERTVKEAREVAEDAARAALEQLGVGEAAARGQPPIDMAHVVAGHVFA